MRTLTIILVCCLVSPIQAQFESIIQPKEVSIELFPQKELMFKVNTLNQHWPKWKDLKDNQKITISANAGCSILIKKPEDVDYCTLQILGGLLILGGDSAKKLVELPLIFSLTAVSASANQAVTGWVIGDKKYFINPIYIQSVNNHLYLSRGLTRLNQPQGLTPLSSLSNKDYVFIPEITVNRISFGIGLIDGGFTDRYRYRVSQENKISNDWLELSKNVDYPLDFDRPFVIEVKNTASKALLKLKFTRNSEFTLEKGMAKIWEKEFDGLHLIVRAEGEYNGKEVELGGWTVGSQKVLVSGSVWIRVQSQTIFFIGKAIVKIKIEKLDQEIKISPLFQEKEINQNDEPQSSFTSFSPHQHQYAG